MSTRPACRACSAAITDDDVNVPADVAYCRICGTLSRLSEMVEAAEEASSLADADLNVPGCRLTDDGVGTTVRASARSLGGALFLLLFTLFWNGILSVFLLVVIASTMQHVLGSVPAWFPAPSAGSSSGSGSGGGGGLGPSMTVGVTIFLWIFLLPFSGVGLVLIGSVLTTLFGYVRVRLRGTTGEVFTGFGPFGWRRRFDVTKVTRVSMGRTRWTKNEEHQPAIVIEADRTIRFGTILPEARQKWMLAVLRRLLET